VVVTGASSGIGASAARQFAALGAHVIPVGRSPEQTARVAAEIGTEGHVADFARLADVRRIADEILARCPRIDVLANNAGGLFPKHTITTDGNELTFQVNHLASFLLTRLLLPRLVATPGSRVIITSSVINPVGHIRLDDLAYRRRRYRQLSAYADSKLANILFTPELARRTAPGGPTATAFHPGLVISNFGRDSWFVTTFYREQLMMLGALNPHQGAEPLVHLAARTDPDAVNGAYLHRFRKRGLTPRQANDPDLASRLWTRSSELVGLPE
jgi:NAD(P)-dependent dehydrogenase (short-subunit alcohol dehydrogenase family)